MIINIRPPLARLAGARIRRPGDRRLRLLFFVILHRRPRRRAPARRPRPTTSSVSTASTAALPAAVAELPAAEHPLDRPVPDRARTHAAPARGDGQLERPARRRDGHLHARHAPARVRPHDPVGRLHLRADRGLHLQVPERSRQGPVPRAGRPDVRRAPVPQQAELRSRRDQGDLRRPAPGPERRDVHGPRR